MKNIYTRLLTGLLLVCSIQTIAQTPLFSSYTSGAPTIFLDFDGHTVSGTQWNTNGPIVCGPSGLTNGQIEEVYNRIAEDYRPFTVNITTDSTKYFAAPANKRVRVIMTISHTWYPQAVGGVSYINSFTWGDNTPAFVFTAAQGYNVKKIAEAGSHEAGHTLGLRHQAVYDANCVKITDYNSGTGTGEIGWAPIMGVGYSKNFTTWTTGPNSVSCTTIQKDMDVITKAANGITYRTDDFQETFGTASDIPQANNQITIQGMISTTADKDMFKVTLAKRSTFFLNAIPYNIGTANAGSDLDLQVQIYDASMNPVGTYNPAPLLNSIVDTILDAGTYYFMLDGKGNQYASEYGSLGSYNLQGTYAEAIILPLHKFELKGSNDNGMHKLNWEVVADEKIVKQTVEVSHGNGFTAIADIAANARSYQYYTDAAGTLQYRVKVNTDNGATYYSNISVIRPLVHLNKPRLAGTVITGSSLVVNAQENYQYAVTDYNGRMLTSGQVAAGRSDIHLPSLAAGSYVIRFTNNTAQFVEKFIKQ
jgi:hypothetical protein